MRTSVTLLEPMLLALLTCSGAAFGQAEFAKVSYLQFPEERVLRSVHAADFDGDGRQDLLLFLNEKGGGARTLQVHLRRDGEPAFAGEPAYERRVDDWWVAAGTGDVLDGGGEEIVFFEGQGAVALRPKTGDEGVILGRFDFLWQFPHPRRVFDWEAGLLDVDGDGRCDLMVPEPTAVHFVLRRDDMASGMGVAASFPLPETILGRRPDHLVQASNSSLSFRPRFVDSGENRLLAMETKIPAPQLVDWDGDGDLDLLVQSERLLHVALQTSPGVFESVPSLEMELPVIADRQRRLDMFYSVHLADLNGDRRCDCVIFNGDQRNDAMRTQVQVFLQGTRLRSDANPLYGDRGLPDELLVIQGFVAEPELLDIDGDGALDLTLLSVRLDELSALDTVAGGGQVDVDLYAFRNTNGQFSRTPDVYRRTSVQSKDMGRGSRDRLSLRFLGDVTGDGIMELLERSESGRLKLLYMRRGRGGLEILPKALWNRTIPEDAEVEVLEGSRGAPELVVLEKHQLMHVRFQ
ncbi:MAG: VCBS repeat-containing protein [Planctomycetes bacterium]|nr:VCBS repeat-containing protein [Planctomycetota bacterium]